jgi:hypothetical protein
VGRLEVIVSDYYAEPPLFAAARRTDPPTSHAAAARVPAFRSGHHAAILEALAAGPAGKTEIGSRCGLTEQQVARRMHTLLAAGVVERTGREVTSASGCGESEYRVTR